MIKKHSLCMDCNALIGRYTKTKRCVKCAAKVSGALRVGSHLSKETKNKISISHTGKKYPNINRRSYSGIGNPNYGKRHSPETIELMRKNRRGKGGQLGESNPMWRGGKLHRIDLCVKEWIKLRNRVYLRDNYRCQICGKYKGKIRLNCHHIIPYRISKDNSFENLISLCSRCHLKEEHLYYNSINLSRKTKLVNKELRKLDGGYGIVKIYK